MPCYHPLHGYMSKEVNPSGKRSIVFNHRDGYFDRKIDLPCGQCIGCRLDRARQWSVRCMHEAQLYEDNCFLTLTYDNDHLPVGETLVKEDFQKFMKRFRKKYSPQKIKYYMCGEYGGQFGRPHYHACIFGFDFCDRILDGKSKSGEDVYTSPDLVALWGNGRVAVGDLTFQSAGYVARYCVDKLTGDKGDAVYKDKIPPYSAASLKPAIGKAWLDKYYDDVYPHDFVVEGGRPQKPPKYYDKQLELADSRLYGTIKGTRKRAAKSDPDFSRSDRLAVRERVKQAQINNLQRSKQ